MSIREVTSIHMCFRSTYLHMTLVHHCHELHVDKRRTYGSRILAKLSISFPFYAFPSIRDGEGQRTIAKSSRSFSRIFNVKLLHLCSFAFYNLGIATLCRQIFWPSHFYFAEPLQIVKLNS